MLRARAREGRVVTVAPLLLALLLATGGCGSEAESSTTEEPSKAAQDCREQWQDLGAEIDGRDERTNPSALATSWSSISAAVEHYATAAKASDCEATLSGEKKAIAALTAFSAKLARFDMELQLAQVRDDAERYAKGPRPPAPKPTPSKKGDKQKSKAAPRPPKPSQVAAALKSLARQASQATTQQRPGWQQAGATDPADAKAVKKAVKDLAFLSEESKAYQAASSALSTIRKAMAATQSATQ